MRLNTGSGSVRKNKARRQGDEKIKGNAKPQTSVLATKPCARSSDARPSRALESLPDVTLMGLCVFDPAWSRRSHRDPGAELLCMMRGRMTLVVAGQPKRDMTAGDFAFVPPGMPHRDVFDPDESPEIFLIQFSWAAQSVFFRRATTGRLEGIDASVRAHTWRTILELRDHSDSDATADVLLARSLLHALLLRLWCALETDAKPRADASRQHDLMERARRYLDTHYHEPIALARMAERLHVSPYYLSRVFSRETGFSLMAYLNAVRMEKAMAMLRAREGNVSEVACAVGYDSAAYFSRVFKRRFGMSPRDITPTPLPVRR